MTIRFPDKVCLQGFFHPRETICDVYDWVNQNLNKNICHLNEDVSEQLSSNTSKKTKYINKNPNNYPFELYTTPPYTVIPYFDVEGNKTFYS